MSNLFERIEHAAEEGLEFVEDAITETICPKIARIESTMNRATGMIRSMIAEVKCCWEHGSWRWASTVLGPHILFHHFTVLHSFVRT